MAFQAIVKNMKDVAAWGGGSGSPSVDCLCLFRGVSWGDHVKDGRPSKKLTFQYGPEGQLDGDGNQEYLFTKDAYFPMPNGSDKDDSYRGKFKGMLQECEFIRQSVFDAEGNEANWTCGFDDDSGMLGFVLLDDDGNEVSDWAEVPVIDVAGYLYWFAMPPESEWPSATRTLPDGRKETKTIKQFGDFQMLSAKQAESVREGKWTPSRPGGAKAKTAAGAADAAGSGEVGEPAEVEADEVAEVIVAAPTPAPAPPPPKAAPAARVAPPPPPAKALTVAAPVARAAAPSAPAGRQAPAAPAGGPAKPPVRR